MTVPNPCTAKPLPSQAELKALLEYDPNTGVLTWKPRPLSMFSGPYPKRAAALWNAKCAGQVAFKTRMQAGHLYSSINAVKFLAHRIIWKMVYNEDPLQIDHINGDPSDNRLANLRNVTHRENGCNVKLSRSNSSGRIGVYLHACGKWCARIHINGKDKHLGLFATFRAASAAREAAEHRYAFHPNHGRAAA